MSSSTTLTVTESLAALDVAEWQRVAGDDPFLSHAFLHALHETGCAAAATGWLPQYLLLHEDNHLVGAMPLYFKSHSWGEYVFDQAWAHAYRQHGLAYYPKLLNAVPFTPVIGNRVLAAMPKHRQRLLDGALALAREANASSFHSLFPTLAQAADMENAGLMLRHGVQFHWHNNDYADFDAFLATMTHDKRKKIKQERRRVREAGISCEIISGNVITDDLWTFFNRCYRNTYAQHGGTPYLNLDFFRAIGKTMSQNLMLVVAYKNRQPIASALQIYNAQRMCGRYWGAVEYHPGLHFETCYYQAIEYCIAHAIPTFEGGAQGEHKIARGLLPTPTVSAHWLARAEFAAAVEHFLAREAGNVAGHMDELNEHAPFK